MIPSDGYVTTADGVRLFFRKAGSGSSVVVIPNAAYMFDDFKYLADHHTLISYDLRNRGRSDAVTDASKLTRGIHHDVDDLEAIRAHFGVTPAALIGHSYVGMVVALYAMQHPAHVSRVVMIGPGQPVPGKQYPKHLTGADGAMAEIAAQLMELQKGSSEADRVEVGKRVWSRMRLLYVADPADADKIKWSVSDLPNESLFNVIKHYSQNLLPSIERIRLTSGECAKAPMPVLVIHGRRDRHAPYGGAREWALMLPDARLITVDNAAHLPWIEAPERVFGAVGTFLGGAWPDSEHVTSLDPAETRGDG